MSSYVRSREGSGWALVNERVSHTSLSLMGLGGNVEPPFACSRTEEGRILAINPHYPLSLGTAFTD